MSRLLQLAVTAVSALALATAAAPFADDFVLDAGSTGGGKIGNWCC
jgi:hypothetical protein